MSAPQALRISRTFGVSRIDEQQVLDRQEFMTCVTRLGKGVIETEFELLG